MDIERSALSLMIHKEGHVTEADVSFLIDWYRENRNITIERDVYGEALERVRRFYSEQPVRLMVCTDGPCEKQSCLNTQEGDLSELSEFLGCPVLPTGCHWECEDAAILTLKLGDSHHRFRRLNSWSELQNVLATIKSEIARYRGANYSKPSNVVSLDCYPQSAE